MSEATELPIVTKLLLTPDCDTGKLIDNAVEAAAVITELTEALEWIAGMTDIEADFDGFEAVCVARAALAKARGQ